MAQVTPRPTKEELQRVFAKFMEGYKLIGYSVHIDLHGEPIGEYDTEVTFNIKLKEERSGRG